MLTLSQFLASELRNAWVREAGFSDLYVRKGQRYINGVLHSNILDIANVTARVPGSGAFTKLVAKLRLKYPQMGIYVESIINLRFPKKLERLGFQKNPDGHAPEKMIPPSYYLLPKE